MTDMNPLDGADVPIPTQVDSDSVMDVEIASITQLTNSVQLAEQPNSLSLQLENDPDARMDLDCDNDPSRGFSSTRNSEIHVIPSAISEWDRDEVSRPTRRIGDSWSADCADCESYEALATGDEAGPNHITHLPTASDSRDVLHAIFESMEGHEDDTDDSEWLDSASVRADTQSIIAGDTEDEYDGETGDDDDEMPVKVWGQPVCESTGANQHVLD